MKTLKKNVLLLVLPAVFAVTILSISSCSKDSNASSTPAYSCLTCHNTPDALVANDADVKGIYKGVMIGSTGTIAINIQNGSTTITATMVIDDVTVLLTSSVAVVDGASYVAPFTGTYNGSPISVTFSVGLGGATPTMTSSDIPGHPNATFTLYKETSTSLIEAFQGTYSKPGETGTFNIILSKGIAKWGGLARADGDTVCDEVSGNINTSNQLTEDNGVIIGTITGDVLTGSFQDGNGATITISGNRTL